MRHDGKMKTFALLLFFVTGVRSQCGDPPERETMQLEDDTLHNRHEFNVGETVRYECVIGFGVESGNGDSTCTRREGGGFDWAVPSLVCSRLSCDAPERPDNGRVEGTEYLFGSTVTFSCNTGYRMWSADGGRLLRHAPIRHCTHDGTRGSWTEETPTCKPVECVNLSDIRYGRVAYTSRAYPSVAKYTCRTGYQRRGTAERSCTANGTWSGEEPTCEEIQCLDPDSDEFKLLHSKVRGTLTLSTDEGHTANFECINGRQKIQSTCTNTGEILEWVPPPPNCIVTTPPPTTTTKASETTVKASETTMKVTETTKQPGSTGEGRESGNVGASSAVPPSREPLPDETNAIEPWLLALLIAIPVAVVLCCVGVVLWKRSKKRPHHRVPVEDNDKPSLKMDQL